MSALPCVRDHLQTALMYRQWGLSVVPVGANKRPEGCWRWYRHRRPSDRELGRLFTRTGSCQGAAVVLGRISGGLGCRDYDTEAGYRRWAARHPSEARTLPTVKTARGYHVYHRSPYEHFRRFSDGDYRSDGGHYALLPGSVHPSGHVYRWHRWHPSPCDFPLADPRTLGLLPDAHSDHGTPEATEAKQQAHAISPEEEKTAYVRNYLSDRQRKLTHKGEVEGWTDLGFALREAVFRSLPTGPGERHTSLWRLAGELKAVDARVSADGWRPVFGVWWALASRVVGTKDGRVSWRGVVTAYRNRKMPAGSLRRSLSGMSADPDPSVRLRAVCGQLASLSPDGVFFLSLRVAAEALGVTPDAARHQLRKAVRSGWLACVCPGVPSATDRRGTARYRLAG